MELQNLQRLRHSALPQELHQHSVRLPRHLAQVHSAEIHSERERQLLVRRLSLLLSDRPNPRREDSRLARQHLLPQLQLSPEDSPSVQQHPPQLQLSLEASPSDRLHPLLRLRLNPEASPSDRRRLILLPQLPLFSVRRLRLHLPHSVSDRLLRQEPLLLE